MKVVHGLLACSLAAPPSLAFAQGGATSSISGLVSDAGGGVLPGATVIVTSNANSATCIQLKAGDCAPRAVVLLAPWFTRFDIGLTKRIAIGGNKSIELRADVLNLFDNVNFTVVDGSRTPGAGAAIFQTDSAYRDLDNTYDPGGRLGQIALRVNW